MAVPGLALAPQATLFKKAEFEKDLLLIAKEVWSKPGMGDEQRAEYTTDVVKRLHASAVRLGAPVRPFNIDDPYASVRQLQDFVRSQGIIFDFAEKQPAMMERYPKLSLDVYRLGPTIKTVSTTDLAPLFPKGVNTQPISVRSAEDLSPRVVGNISDMGRVIRSSISDAANPVVFLRHIPQIEKQYGLNGLSNEVGAIVMNEASSEILEKGYKSKTGRDFHKILLRGPRNVTFDGLQLSEAFSDWASLKASKVANAPILQMYLVRDAGSIKQYQLTERIIDGALFAIQQNPALVGIKTPISSRADLSKQIKADPLIAQKTLTLFRTEFEKVLSPMIKLAFEGR